MAKPSVYQKFLRAFWARMRSDYPFVVQPKEAICVAIPKSSSYYFGRCPMNGMHILVHIWHNPKPWNAGKFTIDVNISAEYGPAKGFDGSGSYHDGEEGLYRLGTQCLGGDRWWCLRDRDRSLDECFSDGVDNFDPAQEDARYFKGNWRA